MNTPRQNESAAKESLDLFKNLIGIKFQLYNSLFTALPFHRVEKTGILLSLFLIYCEESYGRQESPEQIIDDFLSQYTHYATEQERLDLLFRFIQYSERQVVLFDALEDAAFPLIHDMQGTGTLKHLQSEVQQFEAQDALQAKLKDFSVRLVLTAHPTQFYPGEVLGIIYDLSRALIEDNTALVNTYLQQLGKTPFLKKEKPTPYDEAVSLVWYLEHVFYPAAGHIQRFFTSCFPGSLDPERPSIRLGFWPGGDRDGNPFVHADTTLRVAQTLRNTVLQCYHRDLLVLKRRLTFKGVDQILARLENRLYQYLFLPGQSRLSVPELYDALVQIREILLEKHNGLFVSLVEELLAKIEVFGLYFASLDIRQDSQIHALLLEELSGRSVGIPEDYPRLGEAERIGILAGLQAHSLPFTLDNPVFQDALAVPGVVRTIQGLNGPEGCQRYIISHTSSALNVMEVFGLFGLCGWESGTLDLDLVPLFETIDDLRRAGKIMEELYRHPVYREHLGRRRDRQTIMLGFSDGTKDGGYLMANWSIYKAKEKLTEVSRKYGIHVLFFDGRGGPPARGGGKTHQFYASMGRNIANREIQLTIQGQTISSNFGTREAAQFNMEQLLHAGISNELFLTRHRTISSKEESLLQSLADHSYSAFQELKSHPAFLDYLNYASPLRYYSETNIGSRPSSRKKSNSLDFNDLRAVPYVGAWSQLKQNVPGYYGVGAALEQLDREGRWEEIQQLYQHSLFFQTLLDNCEMAMKKSFFPLTRYLKDHPVYGVIWNLIHDEYERSSRYILKLSGSSSLMENYPVDQLSIQMRERIVLPLLTIQQYALAKIRAGEQAGGPQPRKEVYEKLAMRCSFGIINAGRNSA